MKNLKPKKATGPDNLLNEMIKKGNELRNKMYKLINSTIWREEECLKSGQKGLLLPYQKKETTKCENYRRTTLLNSEYKIITSLILKRQKIQQGNIRKNLRLKNQLLHRLLQRVQILKNKT